MDEQFIDKKRGPGRPPGSPNKNPRNTSKIEGKEVEDTKINKTVDEANKKFINGLSGDMQKLYAGFSKRHELPLDDLRELAQSMKARYNIGLKTEIEEHESLIQLAKEEIEDIKKTELLYGQKASETKRNHRIRNLQRVITGKYYISSSLTTLSAELKNVFVEIERIEAGQPKGNVNIFNLLKDSRNSEKIDQLEEEVFTPDSAILDKDDKEYKEQNNDN